MLTKEKKITENLTTREEQHSFWTRENLTPHQSVNTELLIHTEQLMAQKEYSQASQDGLTMLHHSDHSESVTYQSMDTIKILDQTAPTSRTLSKIP